MEVGYVRVSSIGQNTERQLDGIQLEKVFTDHQSGKDKERTALRECLNFVREGDTLHVHSIDRMARNLADLLSLIKELNGKGVVVQFHKEGLLFTGDDSPMQKLHLQIVGAVAEFERALIRERQAEGIALAKKKGVYMGRKRSRTMDTIKDIVMEAAETKNVAAVARKNKVSRNTLYRWAKLIGQPLS